MYNRPGMGWPRSWDAETYGIVSSQASVAPVDVESCIEMVIGDAPRL